MRDSALTLEDSVIEEIRSRFSYPAYEKLPHMPDELKQAAHDPHVRALAQELGGSAQGAGLFDRDAVAEAGRRASGRRHRRPDGCGRRSRRQVFLRRNPRRPRAEPGAAACRQARPAALWKALDKIGLATPNVNLVTDIIACPGLDYCSLANARSIPIAQELTRRFANHDTANMIGRLHINISGCINACGHHHVGHIGILGVEKNGEEFYQITIGGRADENAQMGTLIGPAVPYADVADVIEDIVEAYLALRDRPEELFVDTVKRLGVEPFKERVYATR